MGIIKRIGSIVLSTVVALAVIIAALAILMEVCVSVQEKHSNTERYFFGYKPIIVITGSMEPAIKVNSVSIAKKCSIDDIKIGDIVMYKAENGMLITHRAQEIHVTSGTKTIITKGDANKNSDSSPVTNDNFMAEIIYTANYLAPIISEIMPEPGIINTLSIARGIMLIALMIVALAALITVIIRLTQSVYWAVLGESKFDIILSQYDKDIQSNYIDCNILLDNESLGMRDIRLLNRVKIGIYREKLVSYIRDIEKTTCKIENKLDKYSKAYGKTFKKNQYTQNNNEVLGANIKNNIDNYINKEEILKILGICNEGLGDTK